MLVLPALGLPRHAAQAGALRLRLKDTTAYTNEIYSSRFAVLYRRNELIDSVELDFGVHSVGKDSVVYVRVETLNSGRLKGTYFTKLILYANRKKTPLSTTLEFYNEHFSSPAIIDASLYYWGFKEDKVMAVRKSFAAQTCDTITLAIEGATITESPYHFKRPSAHGKDIKFALDDGQTFILRRDLKSARKIIADTIRDPAKKQRKKQAQ
jgi:hypothetical protein